MAAAAVSSSDFRKGPKNKRRRKASQRGFPLGDKLRLKTAGEGIGMASKAFVQACIGQGTHYLDLSGETFWVQQLIARHHRAAQAAKVRIIPCCGYEALPFDLTALWAATQVRDRFGEACSEVKLVVSFTGKRITHIKDAVSGGTVASMRSLLDFDS